MVSTTLPVFKTGGGAGRLYRERGPVLNTGTFIPQPQPPSRRMKGSP